MTDQTSDTSLGRGPAFPGPFPELPGCHPETLGSLLAGGQRYARLLEACQREILRFAGERLEADAHHWAAIGECRDWNELMTRQQEWLAGASQAYMTEMGRLFQLATQPSPEPETAAGPARPRAGKATH
jgi:hypothetical protein